MSGKYVKKKPRKFPWGIVLVILVLAAVCIAVGWMVWQSEGPQGSSPTAGPAASGTDASPATEGTTAGETVTAPVRVDVLDPAAIDLGEGLYITDVGSYTGIYMEDGSDELVSGVLMIALTNRGEQALQYAQIALDTPSGQANFTVSTLPAGATVILLESSRMEYVPGDYTAATASSTAFFQAPLSLCEDLLDIQILDGAINVTNISGADIPGEIVIYYKNSAADVYYGGITYRVRLEDGLAAGEIRQIVASHFSGTGSSIMFITCAGA